MYCDHLGRDVQVKRNPALQVLHNTKNIIFGRDVQV